ncbi:MAG: calcium/sodium antiporter [Candidatus Magasanikbacteria bacterium]|nr:calcium/sodium antiporter [Candidatus Magasanikbacteria bacterium]
MALTIFLLVLGIGILIAGGEFLVRGSASIAKRLKVSQLVIGLTVVAFGTSAPELVVNIFSALNNSPDLAIGNIVGSNISNILLILGIAAIIYPLQVSKGTVWKEIPLSLLAVILLFIFGNDALLDGSLTNVLSRADGLAFMAFFIIFLYYTFGISKIEGEKEVIHTSSWLNSVLMVLAGIVGLGFGGQLLVKNAIILAQIAGMSESLIGLTIVAIGTSLPELVTAVIAVLHKNDDMAIGNVVGSNIFNIFWILGLTAAIKPLAFNIAADIDLLVNIGATLLLFLFLFSGERRKINRQQGVIFVILYIIYIIYLINRG